MVHPVSGHISNVEGFPPSRGKTLTFLIMGVRSALPPVCFCCTYHPLSDVAFLGRPLFVFPADSSVMADDTASEAFAVDRGACVSAMHSFSLGATASTFGDVGRSVFNPLSVVGWWRSTVTLLSIVRRPTVLLMPVALPSLVDFSFVIRGFSDVFCLLLCLLRTRLAYEFRGLCAKGCLSAVRRLPLFCYADKLI
jgi:hypothetical protein